MAVEVSVASVSQEEEDGSDDDSTGSTTVIELPVPPPRRATRPAAGEEDSDRDSDPAFVSPLDEVKTVHPEPALTMANLHEASRSVCVCTLNIQATASENSVKPSLVKIIMQLLHSICSVCPTKPCPLTSLSSNRTRSQLLQSLRETRAEKKTRRKVLREFEDEFYRQTGR